MYIGTFQDEIGEAIPNIVDCLKDSNSNVCEAAILALTEVLKNGG